MVRVNAPAMSLDASGTLAGTMVFSKWKGRNYVRQRVIPANPKTVKMVSVRAMFKFLTQRWDPDLDAADYASWQERADDMIVSTFNAYVSYNQKRWKSFLAPSHLDPAPLGMTLPVCAGYYGTGGVRMATVGFNCSILNAGWGMLLFRSLSTGFTAAFDNLIAVMPIPGTGDIVHVDSPLEADTYYYNFIKFNHTGLQDTPAGQVTATVT